MNLLRALRLDVTNTNPVISFAGSGGKTTAMFRLALQYIKETKCQTVFLTATSHLGVWQTTLPDHHIIAQSEADLVNLPASGAILITGPLDGDRTTQVNEHTLNWLHAKSKKESIPLLIEADGSRQKSLKAPAAHEPPIPEFTEVVVYVFGMFALGQPLDDEHVHRAEMFSQLSGLALGESITPDAVTKLLTHPRGGLKNIPQNAKRIALLNQAETPELQSIGGGMARELLAQFDSVLVGSLTQNRFQTIERTAGIILAAGKSSRYGQPKQLLDWKGKSFVRHVAETALQAALGPVVVVTGFHHAEIESHLRDLPVTVIHNPNYDQGQSTSIKAGIASLPKNTGSAVFLLADQPQIPVEVIRALMESHANELQPILAPLVLEEKRANPVLFDCTAFPDLMQLTGDVGGRAIFDKHKVSYLPWHDDILLFDVDRPEDYERLKNFE